MNPVTPPEFRALRAWSNIFICGAVLLAGATMVPVAQAQRLPISAGNTVRVASHDSAASGIWLRGRVLSASRRGLLMTSSLPRPDTLAVEFSENMLLEVRRRPASRVLMGGGIGLATGAIMGATVMSSALGNNWAGAGPANEIIGLGFAGFLLGAAASWLIVPRRWESIALSDGRIAPAPLERPVPRTVSLARPEQWRAFQPTNEDFTGFFTAWVDSLDPVEGIWDLNPVGSQQLARVAIARDRRYAGYEYVAVRLPIAGLALPASETRGRIAWVLRRSEVPGQYEIAYPEGVQGSAHDVATVDVNNLLIRRVGTLEDWSRTFPASLRPRFNRDGQGSYRR